jgi:hypothetical protein
MRALYGRRHTAIMVPFEKRTISSGPPQEHQCYVNNDRFCSENPGHKSVYGWLVFDFNRTSEGMWPVCRFTAHAVLEDPKGRLFDITPSKASQRYPFLRHEGPEEEFAAIIAAGYTNLDFQVS